jgi:hypothetical protein
MHEMISKGIKLDVAIYITLANESCKEGAMEKKQKN